MAQQFGKINEFCVEGEDWSEYQDRLEQYYIANDIIVNDKKKAILLSSMGASCVIHFYGSCVLQSSLPQRLSRSYVL